MLKAYGYFGLFLVILAELNFVFVIEPFALFYIPIVWLGYILVVDSLVYMIKGSSLISSYLKEFVFSVFMSVPFWLIFEAYNLFTRSWQYANYTWYIHIIDFTTIMPAILETFTLMAALGLARRFDRKVKVHAAGFGQRHNEKYKFLNSQIFRH